MGSHPTFSHDEIEAAVARANTSQEALNTIGLTHGRIVKLFVQQSLRDVHALAKALEESQEERNRLYAANEEAQTQRVRESHANTDLARSNRALQQELSVLRRKTGFAVD